MTKGLEIEAVNKGSIAEKVGLSKGDIILSINDNPTRDIIDFLFYANDPVLTFKILRSGRELSLTVTNVAEHPTGIGLIPKMFKTKVCKNRCLFCFVNQLPKGLRKSLYLKDEDYRLSFLYGSYITLSNLTEEDKRRIITQRLSPLYISVHSTDNAVREQLLGRAQAKDILDELRFFADNKIYMHTQIVLCPGYNDADVLKKTLNDLCKLYPFVQSVAVVPVGITKHSSFKIRPLTKSDALDALILINKIHRINKRRHGEGIVYAADELFIKSGQPIPPKSYYDDFVQYENGVGMIALFLSDVKKAKLPAKFTSNGSAKFITFTGESFFPYLHGFVSKLKAIGVPIECIKVKNSLFGETVTVAGLLSGRDILKAINDVTKHGDIVIIPNVMLKEGDNQFLDDVTIQDVQKILNVKTVVIESNVKSLLEVIGI